MKFNIITLGCKVNTYESEIIKENFIKEGYLISEDAPDIMVINTCSVTNNADAKSRKLIRKARRDNPHCVLIVCGCTSEQHRHTLSDLSIDILIGTKDKSRVVKILNDYLLNKKKVISFCDETLREFENMSVSKFTNQTRAFLKIQDGCNNYCSYCIIPYLRGNSRFKDYAKVLAEASILVKNGHKEIVLTGINTGSYPRLPELINELSKIKDLLRIRISSLEITQINDSFLDMLKTNDKICNHLHIPLQSGSDKILKLMSRKYNKKYYEDTISKIRVVKPDISITTDVIVGFPGEENKDFRETVDFCKKMNFSKTHVFPYSKRKGTKAVELPNQLSQEIKKKRVKILNNNSLELEESYYKRFLGKKLEVIIEEKNADYSFGYTSNYIKVMVKGQLKENNIYKVRITEVLGNKVIGEL